MNGKGFNIDVEYEKEVVLERLRSGIAEKMFFQFEMEPSKPFVGKISGDRFTIQRSTNFRKDFIPMINGVVHSTSYGTNIKIRMKLRLWTKIMMAIWGIIFFLILISLLVSLFQFRIVVYFLPILLIMGIFVVYNSVTGLDKEFKQSKALLLKVITQEEFVV